MPKKTTTNNLDKLFGSKSRTKLLELLFSNTEKSYYVREITRLIGEQINSVRRELSNLLELGVVKSDTYDNKLYYVADKNYQHFEALKSIFTGTRIVKADEPTIPTTTTQNKWEIAVEPVKHLVRILLVSNSPTSNRLGMLVVGSDTDKKLSKWANLIEKKHGKPLNYTILAVEDYYYRVSVKDKFLTDILSSDFSVVIDSDGVFSEGGENV